MEETIPENSENTQKVEDPPVQESPQESPQIEAPQEPVEPAPEKRGRGRPAGAKDKAPRAKKPRIVEQPLEPEPAPVPVVPAPMTATIVLPSFDIIEATGVPPIFTLAAVAPNKLVPVIVIFEPTHPLEGVNKFVIVGGL